jgi:uncharacterized protein HemX
MPQFSAGDGLTLVLALLASAVGWGSHKQRIVTLEREVRDLKEADKAQGNSAVTIAELRKDVEHLSDLVKRQDSKLDMLLGRLVPAE